MPWRPRRVGTAQSKLSMPRAIPSTRSSGSPMPSRCLRRFGGQAAERHVDHLAHLLLVLAERPADRDPVDPRRGDGLGRLAAQVLVDAALDDPEDRLPRRAVLGVPGEAAVEPAMRALGRGGGVVAVGPERRALVEGERDVRSQSRPAPPSSARARGTARRRRCRSGSDALLVDPRTPPSSGGRPRRPLTSSATAPCASENTWKPPESVMIAPPQPMNRAARRAPRSARRPGTASGGRCCRGRGRSRASRTSSGEQPLDRARGSPAARSRASRPAPCGVWSTPARASPSRARISKREAGGVGAHRRRVRPLDAPRRSATCRSSRRAARSRAGRGPSARRRRGCRRPRSSRSRRP